MSAALRWARHWMASALGPWGRVLGVRGLAGLGAWEEPGILGRGCAGSALGAVRQAANEAAERLGHEHLVAGEPQQRVAFVGEADVAGAEPGDARDRLGVEH